MGIISIALFAGSKFTVSQYILKLRLLSQTQADIQKFSKAYAIVLQKKFFPVKTFNKIMKVCMEKRYFKTNN